MADANLKLPVDSIVSNRWVIRFLSPPRRTAWRKTTSNRWHWTGKGVLTIGADGIQLQGRRYRFLWLSAKQKVQLTRSQIRNVTVTRRVVQFEADAGADKPELVRFVAKNVAAAHAIVEALPTTCTAEVARAKAEQAAFEEALQQTGTRPWVTWALVAANVLVYLAAASHGAGWLLSEPVTLIHWGTNFGPATLSGEWWRIFTSMFLHFGLVHIALNMWALAALGPRIERLFGSARYTLLYLFAGLSGSLASLWWHPSVNSAGASGAIFGIIGGWLAFTLKPATRLPASITANQQSSAMVFILYNLMYGAGHQSIDNACHIGGLIGGILMGWLLAQPLNAQVRQEQSYSVPLGALLGSLTLIAFAWILALRPHPSPAEAAFRIDLLWLGAQDTQAVDQSHQLAKQYQGHAITFRALANEMSADVLPMWEAMETRINGDTLPSSSSLNPLRQAVLTYVDDRRQACELLIRAKSADDISAARMENKMMAESNVAATQVHYLLAQLR